MKREFRVFSARVGVPGPEPPDLLEAIRKHVANSAGTKFVRDQLRNKHHIALSAPPDVTPETLKPRAASNAAPEPPDLAAAIRAARSQE